MSLLASRECRCHIVVSRRSKALATFPLRHQLSCWSFRKAAQARVAAIEIELEQRESILRQELRHHQAASADESLKLAAEVARLTSELDSTAAQVRGDIVCVKPVPACATSSVGVLLASAAIDLLSYLYSLASLFSSVR